MPAEQPLSEEAAASPVPPTKENSLNTNAYPQPLSETTAPPPISHDAEQRNLWAPTTAYAPPIEPTEPKPITEPLSAQATHLFTLSYLVFFAIFGTLARLGLQALTFYPGAPVVTGVLWANVGGSLVMGFFLEDKNLFAEEWGNIKHRGEPASEHEKHEREKKHKAVKKTIPLYIGLTTGFCGCFTSFSSFMRDVFLALTNALPSPSSDTIVSRNGGYSFMALVAVILITVALSLSALIFGAHLALALAPITPTVSFRFMRKYIDPVVVFLGWGCWLGAVFMAIWPPDRGNTTEHWRGRAIFAIVFAPLGCLLRFYVSLLLNARIPSFPLGTFTVNIFGTVIEGMCYDLQHVGGIGTVLTSCQVLQGVMDGFCGSVTTVSTWVSELNGLSRRRYAYIYGVSSVAVGLGFLVVIMGSLGWTIGYKSPICE
ncbi:hypothetical protein ASPWEDRAFT_458712 [Aspergillus wentii DTO 134E9]|uniref:Chromosome condensation protein n=1 Tax=Aspergillus wentii DTO 134E9 TaxID=1073089 RepID=A0A1L9RRF2_ASPWE|nr:uncharacterized protein ASPWEDRAFT_458712 [Aspergillus wentii DTO 134E9]OJJ37546.1 hypothetical protein ASPWEDRAFT_458712 [Aspergillus wentii DTO 134E9]